MTESFGGYVGGSSYAFRVGPSGELVPWTSPSQGDPLANGPADIEIEVGLYLRGGRVSCGKVVVSTQPLGPESRISPLGDGSNIHIDAALWRAIPIGALIEGAFAGIQRVADHIVRHTGFDLQARAAAAGLAQQKRGRPSDLIPEMLTTVARAYIAGGRKPVIAVREALQSAGYPGSGPKGQVTIDQARKAVVRARREGFIPPAKSKGGTSQ